MDGPADDRVCANEQCRFAETTQCVEGNDISECPYLKVPDATAPEDDEETTSPGSLPQQSVDEFVHLGGEDYLSIPEASLLLKARSAPIIAFLGPVGAGKTSLIAEVYDAFQYKTYKSLAFAGSRTLIAFERICHKVRAASRAHAPTQDRSEIRDDPFFFHLTTRVDNTGRPIDILLADRSGETYRAMADTPTIAAECLELRRAATFNILVDGARLCDPVQRASALIECSQTLQTLAMSGILAQDVSVNLVMTKLDLVDVHENKTRARGDFESLCGRSLARYGGSVARIDSFKIAACPQNNKHLKGYGVEALVKSWVATEPPQGIYSNPILIGERAMSRASSSLEAL